MNNGKVRIYELSRELNLDNKDILNICEGLNISVKSHSSTITESEAERIRTAAEKYSDRPTVVRNRENAISTEGGPRPPSTNKSMNGSPNIQRKQQILEIRKPKPRPSSSSQLGSPPAPTPPQPPVKPTVAPPSKPINFNRPARVNQQDAKPELSVEPEQQGSQLTIDAVEVEEKNQLPEPQRVEAQLSEPPVRPSKSKPQLTQVERPIIRKNRPDAAVAGSSSTPAPIRAASPSQPSTVSDSSKERPRSPSRPSIPTPTLQEPPRRIQPVRDGGGIRSTARGGDDSAEGEDGILETPEMLAL